jgi:hypothetical protein
MFKLEHMFSPHMFLKIRGVLDGLGLFWTRVVPEKPCRVCQRGRGGRIDVDFLESEGGSSLGAELCLSPKNKSNWTK